MQLGNLFKVAVGAISAANHNLRRVALERIGSFFTQAEMRHGEPSQLVPKQLRIPLPSPQGLANGSQPALEVMVPTINLQSPVQLGVDTGHVSFDYAITSLAQTGANIYLDGTPVGSSERRRPTRMACMHVRIEIKSVGPSTGEARLTDFLTQPVKSH
jgi:hypothetical protein